MEKIVALCKRRGLIFASSEIYGGVGSSYDYGHYGVLLKNNVKGEWWHSLLQERDDVVALDSAIIQHPRTWEASGHIAGFTDPARRLPDLQAAVPRRQARGRAVRPKPSLHPGEGPELRPDRGAQLQPDVPDDRRAGAGRGLDRVPAAGDRAGNLPELQALPPVRAQEAAVRDRPGGQELPQRDHARELRVPHARVRADGDGVLRAAGRRGEVVRVLEAGAVATGT